MLIYVKHCEAQSIKTIQLKPRRKSNATKKEKVSDNAKKLYLNEKYLRVIKRASPTMDSKFGVDRPTKKALAEVLVALDRVDETSYEEARAFVHDYLHEPGFEIVKATFIDWSSTPKYIDSLKSESLRSLAYYLNETWKNLYKKCDHGVLPKLAVSSHVKNNI